MAVAEIGRDGRSDWLQEAINGLQAIQTFVYWRQSNRRASTMRVWRTN